MICGVLHVKDVRSIEASIKESLFQNPNILEFRLDGANINFNKFQNILHSLRIPYILSLRSEWYNSQLTPPVVGRVPFLKKMIDMNPPYMSFEYPLDVSLIKHLGDTTIPIITLEDFEGIAKIDFETSIQLAKKYPNSVIKISAHPNTTNDLLTILRWSKSLKKHKVNFVIIGMGQLGSITRIKSEELGSIWTYGRLNVKDEEPQYPGMISIDQLKRSKASTHILGISNGKFPFISSILKKMIDSLSADIVFIDQTIAHPPEADHLLMLVRDFNFAGAHLNLPWSIDLIELLDVKDQSVMYTNQCDTIQKQTNLLKGLNAKVYAIEKLLEPYMKTIRKVYIEGIDFNVMSYLTALRKYNLDYIVVRTSEQGVVDMLKQINPKVISEQDAYFKLYDLFINCHQPYPGFENVLPVAETLINDCQLIVDQLSTPTRPSALAKYLQKNGKTLIDGWNIYSHTIASSLSFWLNLEVDVSKIALQEDLEQGFIPEEWYS